MNKMHLKELWKKLKPFWNNGKHTYTYDVLNQVKTREIPNSKKLADAYNTIQLVVNRAGLLGIMGVAKKNGWKQEVGIRANEIGWNR